MKDQCRITLVQLPEEDDPQNVLDRMPGFFEAAAEYGSDLIAFPEYCLGRRITLEDQRVQRFLELAHKHRMYAVAGLIESMGKQWATTALMVDRSGALLGRYLKTHPAAGVAPHWWPPLPGHDDEARGVLGDCFKVWPLDFGTIGIIQCYDGYFPEAWGCTSYMGAEIIVWINGRGSPVQDATCMYMAQSYTCVVAGNVSNGYNTGFAEPAYGTYISADGEREEGRLFPRIPEPGPACVHATIDLAKVRDQRKHSRMVHQRRPELYSQLTRPATIWKDYPDIPWAHPGTEKYVNKAQLPTPPE